MWYEDREDNKESVVMGDIEGGCIMKKQDDEKSKTRKEAG